MPAKILKLREYQRTAANFLYKYHHAALFADPGLGKTAITLSLINHLKAVGRTPRVLLIAPLRVASITWPDELAEWQNFEGISFHLLHGRGRDISIEADIHLINPEGLAWLWEQKLPKDQYNMLVVDESPKFKNFNKRTKSLIARVERFDRRIILTGTPAANGLLNLFTQIKIVDNGYSLGRRVGAFRERYFYPSGYKNYSWSLKEGSEEAIYKAIAPVTLRLSADKYLDIPPILYNIIKVELSSKDAKEYRSMQKKLFAEIDDAKILSPTKAASYGKCRQLANGFAYDKDVEPHIFHKEKINALVDFIDSLQGRPCLVAYWYKYDLEMIVDAIGKVPTLNGGTNVKTSAKYIKMWNNDEIPVMLAQPVSCSHGLNLQKGTGCDIVWYSIPDDLEIYSQFNDRIHRSGVKTNVRVHHIVTDKTVDLVNIKRLKNKDRVQKSFLDSLQEYRDSIG